MNSMSIAARFGKKSVFAEASEPSLLGALILSDFEFSLRDRHSAFSRIAG